MRALILGSGPTGLVAAQAAHERGLEVVLVSKTLEPSPLFGCQYLHAPIPGFEVDSHPVKYELSGTYREYAEKVYGPGFRGEVSPSSLNYDHTAWDLRETYRQLWESWKDSVNRGIINNPTDMYEIREFWSPDILLSTIPLMTICHSLLHGFEFAKCWAVGETTWGSSPIWVPPFTVQCDGTKDRSYYRAANVFDRTTVEWPGWRSKPPIGGVVEFLKPVSTTCDCWPDVVRLGRYGKWEKGVLVHHAYQATGEAIEKSRAEGSAGDQRTSAVPTDSGSRYRRDAGPLA